MTLITFKEAKGNFFDRDRVQNALGRGLARGMSRIGARIRTVARRSIRPARRMRRSELSDFQKAYYRANPGMRLPLKSSEPGKPPRDRSRLLKDFIFYNFEPKTKTVVIGPTALSNKQTKFVPRILERGGTSTITVAKQNDKDSKPIFVKKTVRIAPRPYMRPAFKLVRPSIGREFRNLLRIR